MKTPWIVATALALTFLATGARAQAYPSGYELHRNLRSDRGALGIVTLPGQQFAAPMPMVATAANPAVAVLGAFQQSTIGRSLSLAAMSVCPDERSDYLSYAGADIEGAAAFLAPYTVREALQVFQWGPRYVVVIARLRSSTDLMMRYYPLKQLGPNSFCLTRDLRGDNALLEVAGMLLANINGTLY